MNKSAIYYLIAFLEGGLVMAQEVIAARLLSPYFGTSLHVITSILGITMLALLLGYFLGGRIVKNQKSRINYLPITLVIVVSVWLIICPIVSASFLKASLSLGLIGGTLLGTLILLGLPLLLCGMVSPMLIQLIHESGPAAGTSSGNIYAVSTLGGVITTFLVGLLLIPNVGVKMAALLIGVITGVLTLLLAFLQKKYIGGILGVSFLIASAFICNANEYQPFPSYKDCLYTSDGLLGRIDVCDFPNGSRILSNNGTDQSKLRLSDGVSLMMYNHVVATASSLVPKNHRNHALVIGLAGGSIIKELKELGYDKITAVDIDPRTKYVAEKFFELNPNTYTFVESDGRHFVKTTPKAFDLIIVDASASEQQPYHLYTNEAISDYKKVLNENGLLVFNIIDFIQKDKGQIVEHVADGLAYHNLSPRLLNEFYPLERMDKNHVSAWIHERILIASKNAYLTINSNPEDLTDCCKNFNYCQLLKRDFQSSSFSRENAPTQGFYDDIPMMESLNFERVKRLRNQQFIF